MQKIEETFAHQPRISVAVFQGIHRHFARSIDAGFILGDYEIPPISNMKTVFPRPTG